MTATALPPTAAPARRHAASLSALLVPRRTEVIDLAFLLTLSTLGLLELRPTFGGWTFLWVGGAALVIGVAIAFVTFRLRQPVLALAAATMLVFFLLGGAVALQGTALGGVLPTLATVRGLADGAVHGWMQLLTTVRPVGSMGNLMVIPYVIGLVAGVVGFSLACRTRWTMAPLLAPGGVLAVAILFGPDRATLPALTGGALGVLGIAWLVVRHARSRPVIHGAGVSRRIRPLVSVVLLAVSAVAAVVAGPWLPFAGAHSRVVLHADPPFDPSAYPSPLAGFRKYRPPPGSPEPVLFTVKGLPPGVRLRLATMDTYDGVVWGVGVDARGVDGSSGSFRRVGTTIPTLAHGASSRLSVTIGPGYSDVWLPDAGAVTSVRFTGARAAVLASALRYNEATSAAVVPARLLPGDSYRLRTVLPPVSVPASADRAPAAAEAMPVSDPPSGLAELAQKWSASATTPYAKVTALANYLRSHGAYSDGYDANIAVAPGHGNGRLTAFLAAPQPVGDDEQFAAALALLANSLAIPTRVVLGAIPERDGTVKAADMHAWAEVHLRDVGWVAVSATPDKSKHPNPQPPTPRQQQATAPKIVPPPVAPPPPAAESVQNPRVQSRPPITRQSSHLLRIVLLAAAYVGSPVALIAVVVGTLLGLKSRRRRRRQHFGPPTSRIAGGWQEIVDLARDLGRVVPGRRTRREQAALVDHPIAMPLARDADAAVFGPADPGPDVVEAYWRQVTTARRQLTAGLSRWRRVRVALNPVSLRPAAGVSASSRPRGAR